MRLELADLVQRGAEAGPVLLHLVLVRLRPEQGRAGDAPHAQRRQADRFAGGIDLAQLRLAQAVLIAVLGQHPARLFRDLLRAQRGRAAQDEQHDDQHDHRHAVDPLAAAGTLPRTEAGQSVPQGPPPARLLELELMRHLPLLQGDVTQEDHGQQIGRLAQQASREQGPDRC